MSRHDAGLVFVLEALLIECNITRAARRMNLSQPAMSNALARLREVLGDPLLVKSGRGMTLTPRAQALFPKVCDITRRLNEVWHDGKAFDPASLATPMTIAVNDPSSHVLMPAIVERVQSLAPGVMLEISACPPELPVEAVASGRLDLIITHDERLPDQFRSRTLYAQQMVFVARSGHSAIGERLTLDNVLELPHLVASPTSSANQNEIRRWFTRHGLERKVLATVQQFSVAARIAARTDALALLSLSSAILFARELGLVIHQPPDPMKLARVPIKMIWHERTHADAAHRWLRAQCVDVAASIPGASIDPA